MASNYKSGAVDTDDLFAPFSANSPANPTGYQVATVDVRTRYDIIANPALANAGARIPLTGIKVSKTGFTADTDLASVFCGNLIQYNQTEPANGTKDTAGGWTSSKVWEHVITVTFASAAALTDYFFYGGRILIHPSQSGVGVDDANLESMFNEIGNLTIYDVGHYRTGTGGTVQNASTGGSNVGTTPVNLFTIDDIGYTGGLIYTVSMVANAAAGSATVLTITTRLTTSVGTFAGTYESEILQRNHPTQAVPTLSSTMTSYVLPTAQFSGTPTSATTPFNVTFTDLSTGTPTSWLWNFGDGTTSTSQNPVKNYATPGTYTVTLTATNAAGSDEEVKTNYITAISPTFSFTIAAHQANANLRSLALAAGWDGTVAVIATIASGYYMSSTVVGTPGLTINGSWPGGVTLNNQGVIVGMGGAASAGRQASASAGGAGGLALLVSVPVTINNSGGTIAGGGGGGGGGGYGYISWSEFDPKIGGSYNYYVYAPGGGGGGGRATLSANAGGGGGGGSAYAVVNGSIINYGSAAGAGGTGTVSAQAGGGGGAYHAYAGRAAGGGTGGSGGAWGSAGGTGGTGGISGSGANGSVGGLGGGAGGAATSGNANITWTNVGTRIGALG